MYFTFNPTFSSFYDTELSSSHSITEGDIVAFKDKLEIEDRTSIEESDGAEKIGYVNKFHISEIKNKIGDTSNNVELEFVLESDDIKKPNKNKKSKSIDWKTMKINKTLKELKRYRIVKRQKMLKRLK